MATLFFVGEHTEPRPEKGSLTSEPVRLSVKEAAEAVPVVLASIIVADKRSRLPLLAEADIKIERARLVYIPFTLEAREWKHRPSGQVMPINVVEFGANL